MFMVENVLEPLHACVLCNKQISTLNSQATNLALFGLFKCRTLRSEDGKSRKRVCLFCDILVWDGSTMTDFGDLFDDEWRVLI
jgi:hypothetical protein